MNGISCIPSVLKFIIELIISLSSKIPQRTITEKENDETEGSNTHKGSSLQLVLNKLKQNNKKPLTNKREVFKRGFFSSVNFISMLMQVSIIPIVLTTSYLLATATSWYLPLAILLVSLSSIRNYLELNVESEAGETLAPKQTFKEKIKSFSRRFVASLKKSKRIIDKSRHKIGLITNIWKIAIFLLFAHIFNPKFKFESILSIGHNNQTKNGSINENKNSSFSLTTFASLSEASPLGYFIPFVIFLLSTVACYLASSLAYKLRMHRFCFSLPMTLTTPASLLAALLICELKEPGNFLRPRFVCASDSYFSESIGWHLIIGMLVWWISHLWTTSSIWLKYELLFNFGTIKRVKNKRFFFIFSTY
jgi:hypothetical protein